MVRWGSAGMLESSTFNLLQCLSVGLICGVAFLHIFADAQEDLGEVCEFPVGGCFLLMGCFLMVAMNRVTSLIAARHATAPQESLELNAQSTACGGSFGQGSFQ